MNKTDLGSLFTEAASAKEEIVLSDQTTTISAGTATQS